MQERTFLYGMIYFSLLKALHNQSLKLTPRAGRKSKYGVMRHSLAPNRYQIAK
jgi:hypothetical protein